MRLKYKRLLGVLLVIFILITTIPSVAGVIDIAAEYTNTVSISSISETYRVNMHFLSTGCSDCIILQCDGHVVIIDGGEYQIYDKVDKYLQALDITQIDAIINTHPDSDHIGCIPKIIENYNVSSFYCTAANLNNKTPLNLELLNNLEDHSVNVMITDAGDGFSIGDFSFDFLSPTDELDDNNSMSLVTKVTCQQFSALFSGDTTKEILKDLSDSGVGISADILKIPHHGSNTSTDPETVTTINPQLAVLTVGSNNYGLPNPEVLDIFADSDIQLLRTDINGNIIISTNCNGEYIVTVQYQEE